MWDLAVIGLGPAGSTAARVASAGGFRVLGIDKAEFPRYKPCAGGLTGRAEALLPPGASATIERRITRARLTLKNQPPIIIDVPEGLMATSRREILDTALVEAAESAGSVIRDGCEVRYLNPGKHGIEIVTEQGTESARFVLGADGANSRCARMLHASRLPFLPAWEVEYAMPDNIAVDIRSEVRFDIGVVSRGYGWSFPKGNTIAVGVSGRVRRRSDLDAAFHAMLERLPGSESWRAIHKQGHPIPLFSHRTSLAGSRIVLTGDAAGLIDPFLGEGIYYAVKSGSVAAEWVLENCTANTPDYSEYHRKIHADIGRELRIAHRLTGVIYRFPGMMYRMASKKPGVLTRLGRCLASGDGYPGFARELGYPYKAIFWGLNTKD